MALESAADGRQCADALFHRAHAQAARPGNNDCVSIIIGGCRVAATGCRSLSGPFSRGPFLTYLQNNTFKTDDRAEELPYWCTWPGTESKRDEQGFGARSADRLSTCRRPA